MLDETHKKFAEDVFKTVPFIKLIGLELVEITKGEATLHLKMREELQQPFGLMHGGAIASLIDTATAFAVVSVLEKEENAVTIDLHLNYLRPVSEGKIFCTAKVIKAGKRILTVSAEITNEEGKLVATALSTYTKV